MDSLSDDDNFSDTNNEEENGGSPIKSFEIVKARNYQTELLEHAIEKNSILVLGTGSGKTYISILLLREFADEIAGKYSEGAKRSIFIVNTVPLVHQQAEAIEKNTPFKVGKFEGSMGVDDWTEAKWIEELDKCEVLVLSAQILLNLILHKIVPLYNINLLIMDECHNATGCHPMREIMNEYQKILGVRKEKQTKYSMSVMPKILELPKLLGLTACIISGACKPGSVEYKMKELENTMHSALVTSKYQDSVKEYTTRPREILIEYYRQENCEAIQKQFAIIEDQLKDDINTIFRDKIKRAKVSKFVKNICSGIINITVQLGLYVFHKAIEYEINYLKNDAECDSYEDRKLYSRLADLLEGLLKMNNLIPQINRNDPYSYISHKLKKLLDILRCYKPEKIDDFRILIFVERRNSAKLLHSVLLELKNFDRSLMHLKPESLVGGTSNTRSDLKVNQDILKQKKVLSKFRGDECNVIVSTSVLEEGIDVRKCNCVIRFDELSNFRSYVQSLGRARADDSKFLIMTEDTLNAKRMVATFKEINYVLTKACHGRLLPSEQDVMDSFANHEIEPPYAPYGSTASSPQITVNGAIQLLNKYCGALPHDKFTDLNISYYIKEDNVNETKLMYHTKIILPKNSPYKSIVWGTPMENREDSKKSAALKLCKELHKFGELNHQLLPKKLKEEFLIDLKLPHEPVKENEPQPGTRNRRQIYDRKICLPFQAVKHSNFHLHLVEITQEVATSKCQTENRLGILCPEEIKCCPFQLYCSEISTVNVHLHTLKNMNLNRDQVLLFEKFNAYINNFLLHYDESKLFFSRENANHSILLVPLLRNSNDIDNNLINSVSKIINIEDLDRITKKLKKNLNIFDLNNQILCPKYRSSKYYLVEEMMDLTPLSPFPQSKNKYHSYEEYFAKEYKSCITDLDQKLWKCKDVPRIVNKLLIGSGVIRKSSSHPDNHPNMVPELCYVLPFDAGFYYQLALVPSILHRVNGLMIEKELYALIDVRASPKEQKNFTNSWLDYKWCEKLITRKPAGYSNLSIWLKDVNSLSIYPGAILQALTPISSSDNFNLERLEVLGDSFLKYMISIHLFFNNPSYHEGQLTLQRSQFISNKTLYGYSKQKDLTSFIQSFKLEQFTAIPYGLNIPNTLENKLIKEKVSPRIWKRYFSTDLGVEEHMKEAFIYHPWKEQVISDKGIADSCEALIGVYLLCGGEKSAKKFMQWLGYQYLEDYSIPKTALINIENYCNENALKCLISKMRLENLEEEIHYRFRNKSFLIQALTHPTDTRNKLTDCYQRLEFLGDAVLDYLVTGFIYSNFSDFDPGQMTDMRSHLVNNETLAKAAVEFHLNKYLQYCSLKLATTISKFIILLDEGETEFANEKETYYIEDIEVPKVMGDLVESIIGAVYIDSGECLNTTWNVIQTLLHIELNKMKNCKNIPINELRKLHELSPDVKINFGEVEEGKLVTCKMIVPELGKVITGEGKNKKLAKLAAARRSIYEIQKKKGNL